MAARLLARFERRARLLRVAASRFRRFNFLVFLARVGKPKPHTALRSRRKAVLAMETISPKGSNGDKAARAISSGRGPTALK